MTSLPSMLSEFKSLVTIPSTVLTDENQLNYTRLIKLKIIIQPYRNKPTHVT